MPIAIEVFEASDSGTVRIDINGDVWATVRADALPEKLAEIARAYIGGELAALLRQNASTK